MALDISQGCNYLHSLQPMVIHRDLKSSNVLVDRNFNLKVCDFGVGKTQREFAYSVSQVHGRTKFIENKCSRNSCLGATGDAQFRAVQRKRS